MVSQEKVTRLILKVLKDLIDTFPESEQFVPNEKTVLFGQGATIDSLTLVSFVVDLEALLTEEFTQDISLTDDRAMTRAKSPFDTVLNLAEYSLEIVDPALIKSNA